MKILTGKDKRAFERLEFVAKDYLYFLSKMKRHTELNSDKITFVCTNQFIDAKTNDIKRTLDGTNDIYRELLEEPY